MAGMEIQHTDTSDISDDVLRTHISSLSGYRDELKTIRKESTYNTSESLLHLPLDESLLSDIKIISDKLDADNLTDLVVVGMGGSVRGLRAVYDLLADKNSAQLHLIDTISSDHISKVVADLYERKGDLKQVVVCIISKSGQTIETISNANILFSQLQAAFPATNVMSRTVVVSQSSSELTKSIIDAGGISTAIPEQVSGRFSVFSAAGLLPLHLIGIDVTALQNGARKMLEACLSGRAMADPAAALAAILFAHTEENVRIINHTFFSSEARGLGRWLEQLFAESLGKRTNRRGEPVFSGLYPVTTIAPEDLHADLQLQLAGAKNFFTIFVEERSATGDLNAVVSADSLLPNNLQTLAGRSLADIQQASSAAVKAAFKEAGRPFVSVVVDSFSPERVGQFLLLEELIVMYLAELLKVNAFSQPQVEDVKRKLFDNLDI